MVYYNCPKGKGTPQEGDATNQSGAQHRVTPPQNFQRNLKNPLDKTLNLWYNVNVIKGDDQHQKGIDTMTNTKTTIRSQFEDIRAILVSVGREDLVEFIDGRIAQTIKKNSAERKPTPKQIENDGFKADILAYMEADVLYSAGDILKGVPSVVASGMSINRVSALMTQLADSGAVTKTVDKRKNFYSLA